MDRKVQRARLLRKEATYFEDLLWSHLRGRRLRGKWRRQVPLGPFIVDFACFSAKLVVELDGDSHVGADAQDAARDAYLNSLGFRVLRIDNNEVRDKLALVLEWIWQAMEE